MDAENQRMEYPIIGTYPREYIPWDVLAPHEAQAMKNHGGQTLERLAQRGGLSWRETLAVIKDKKFDDVPVMSEAKAKKIVLKHVAAWEEDQRKGENDDEL